MRAQLIVAVIMILGMNFVVEAAKFTSSHPCSDLVKTCLSRGSRVIDGLEVTRDCWEYSYQKTCDYPSKNNCESYKDCYFVALKECLLQDSMGNCVNQLKEFSCKRWVPVEIDSNKVRQKLEEKEGVAGLVCKGIPCIDGNCVDKSYQTNGEMMDAISKLYAVSQMQDAKDMNFQLFSGFSQHCSKKAVSYSNCCSLSMKGWGHNLGARGSKEEQDLIDKRQKNLCVYVGKENKKTLGVTTVVKHHYCCFGNILNKVMQVEGRKQLGISFGSKGSPNCRGLTLAEIMQLNFEQMDFSEFIEDFKTKFFGKYQRPDSNDLTSRVKGSLPDIKKYDGNSLNKDNNKAGWSNKLPDDFIE